LVPLALEDVIKSKEYQYKNANVRFNYSFDPGYGFVFIRGDHLSFERMMSNLINNAVEAATDRPAVLDISFDREEDRYIRIIVKDNGKGMSESEIDAIRKRSRQIGSTKHEGYGIGLEQILSTIDFCKGQIEIESRENVGTTVIVKFLPAEHPQWVAEQLTLHGDDTVVILDDDATGFYAFRNRLEGYSKNLKFKFFTRSRDALGYINFSDNREKIVFLCGYELKNDDFNGLTLILQSGIKDRAFIVTGISNNRSMCDAAELSGVKILLKQFLQAIPIVIC
jgi:anti-sigma regulatory factor (Ser/Thr protein kinase)